MSRPQNTFAVVVGVEQYAVGSDWDLDGPAGDACRFVTWLRQRGVPAERIQLFVSPRDANQSLVQQLDVSSQRAEKRLITTLLTDTLPKEVGDLLIFFWGGHGVIDAKGIRRLFYTDATQNNLRHLNLNNLLESWRTDFLGSFPQQICFVDACASYIEYVQLAVSLPEETFPTGTPVSGREQFVLLAASPGELAKNRNSGVFSTALLEQLHQAGQSWPPDVAHINLQLQAKFAALRDAGDVGQKPAHFWYRDWQGNEGGLGTLTRKTVPGKTSVDRELSFGNAEPTQGAQGTFNAPVTFNQYGEIRPAVPTPEEVNASLQQFLALPLDNIPNPAPLPVGSRMPFSVNPHFVGRSSDLQALAQIVKRGGTAAIGQIAAATGIGGIGKTQLASEFVHRYGQYFLGGVFWLNFADTSAIPAEVASCGGTAGMSLRPDFADLSHDDQVKLVFAAWQSSIPRLLIFDNCEDEKLVASWRPPTGGARVIVTSRRHRWSRTLNIQPLRLEALSRQESISLLCKHRPDLATADKDLDAIASEIGDLPLALHLAGSYLESFADADFATPKAYLAHLKRVAVLNHPSLLGEGATFSPTAHDQHVARTFMLSYERLSSTDPIDTLALALLARAAYCAPGLPIPRDFLLATLHQEGVDSERALQQEKAIARLLALGLLEEEEERALYLHRLLTAFVRAVSNDTTAQNAVEELLLDVFLDSNEAGDVVGVRVLEPHLRAVTECAMPRGDEWAITLCNRLGCYLRISADFQGARYYQERALAMAEELFGKGHLETAHYLNALGDALYGQSNYSEARYYFERAIPLFEQQQDYSSMAASLDNLGQVLSYLGEMEASLDSYEAALEIREKVLGPQHFDTSTTLHNLGSLHLQLGDRARAREYYERALAIREQLNHPRSAATLRMLGVIFFEEGHNTRALECYERALAISERALGPTHPKTISSLQGFVFTLVQVGEHKRALDLQQKVSALIFERKKKGLWITHETATALNNNGYFLWTKGEYNEARRFYEEALAADERLRGNSHLDHVVPLNNIGMVLAAQGNYEQARGYYERALSIQDQGTGGKGLLTAKIMNNLGVLYRMQGELVKARQCLERTLSIRKQIVGEMNSDTATTLNNLGVLLQAEGDLTGAQEYIERGLSICRQVVGDSHADTARSLHDLGMLFHAKGAVAEARRHLEHAIAIRERVLGDTHPDLAMALKNLGNLLVEQGNKQEARTYFERALKIYERQFPSDHPEICLLRQCLDQISST